MAKITFISSKGEKTITEGKSGSVMELAVQNKVAGIDGNCGGVCSCATCHVHVNPAHWDKTGTPNSLEHDMLEFDDNVSEYSRLSCQIKISEALDGLELTVAK